MSFSRVAIIGLGLLGGSIGLALREFLPDAITTGYDQDPDTRRRATTRGLVDKVCETSAEAVATADLVIFCVPPGAMAEAAREIAGSVPHSAVISDVGSCKVSVAKALSAELPDNPVIPAHPVAGTEKFRPGCGLRRAVPPALVHPDPACGRRSSARRPPDGILGSTGRAGGNDGRRAS